MAHRTPEPVPDREAPTPGVFRPARSVTRRLKPSATAATAVRRALRRAALTLAVFSLCINLLLLAVPVFFQQIFDRVITSRGADTLLILAVAVVLAAASLAALEMVRARLLVRIGLWLDQNLSGPLFAQSLKPAGPSRFTPSQAVSDLARVRAFLASPAALPLLDAPSIPLFVAVVYLWHPLLGICAGGAVLLLLAVAFANDRMTRAPFRSAALRQHRSLVVTDSMSRYADAIEANGMVAALIRWWNAHNGQILETSRLASDRAGTCIAIVRFLNIGAQITILTVAAWLVIRQQLSPGAMVAAFLVVGVALAPIERLVRVWGRWQEAREAFRRLAAQLDKGAEITPVQAERPIGRLEAANVAFSPRTGEPPLFEAVSFSVAPGEILGIAGPSGTGKTSLARMLVGLLPPSQGTIRLDGRDVRPHAGALGAHVGFVPQNVELLPGSVRDNIARFFDTPAATVVAAARAAGIHEHILALPDGYDTAVGGPNDQLSAGMRQRVALARALFGGPQLLVLDEPYSNLDDDGLQALMASLEAARARRATVVLVAHRASLLARADKVLQMRPDGHRLLDREAWAELRVVGGEAPDTVPAKIPAKTVIEQPTEAADSPVLRYPPSRRATGRGKRAPHAKDGA